MASTETFSAVLVPQIEPALGVNSSRRAGAPGSGYVAAREPPHRESVNCHRDRRESFLEFKQAPRVVDFLCQPVTDFDRFSVGF